MALAGSLSGILHGMNRVIDGIAALLASAFLALGSAGQAYSEKQDALAPLVAGLLVATVLLCAAFLAKGPREATAIALLSVALAAFAPGSACFLPVAAYLGMMQTVWSVRVLWVLAWLWIVAHGAPPLVAAGSLAFGALVSAFAVRTVRTEALLSGLQSARDDVSERLLELRAERAAAPAGGGELHGGADGQGDGGGADASSAGLQGFASGGCAGRLEGAVFRPSAAAAFDAPQLADEQVFRQGISRLTERELSIARLVAEGCTNRQIAGRLFLSEGTVRNHVSSILQKTCAENRTQLALLFRP